MINRDDGTGQSNSNTGDKSTNNKLFVNGIPEKLNHSDVLRCALNDSANAPDNCTKLDCVFSADFVGKNTGSQSTAEGTTGHGGGDTALLGRIGIIEVGIVLWSSNYTANAANIEPKQHAAEGSECSNEVYI